MSMAGCTGGSQLEPVATTAMEEICTSTLPGSQGGEEEEDQIDEISESVQKEGFGDVRQFEFDQGECQDVIESDKAHEKHKRDEDLQEFDFGEYTDPLTEDSDIQTKRNYDRKISEISLVSFVSRSESTSSGISGLMNKLEGLEIAHDGEY